MSNTEKFDASLAGLVNTERQAVYGHPADNFRRIAAMQAITAECTDPEIRVALDNIVLKVCRLIQTPTHLDSWIDIGGYARCGVMILDRREPAKAKA
jgi:hypothetical protein